MSFKTVKLGDLIDVLTDYHANGAYKKLKENVELLDKPNYAVMIRTTNFEQNTFDSSLKYITEHAYNFLEKSKVYPNDIIMNKIANAGSSYLMPDLGLPVSLAMNLFLIRADIDKVNPVYLYTYLKVHENYVKTFANGSVTKTITKEAVRNLEIKLPSKKNQDKISEVYSNFSDKIELNRQMNKTLEAMAQAIFKSWFVDFDPVHAKANAIANGQDPEAAAMEAICGQNPDLLGDPEKLRDIASLFPSEFVESELGLIPKGWEDRLIGEMFDLQGGHSFKSQDYVESG